MRLPDESVSPRVSITSKKTNGVARTATKPEMGRLNGLIQIDPNQSLNAATDLMATTSRPATELAASALQLRLLALERGQAIARVADAKGRIAEIQLQVLQVDQELSSCASPAFNQRTTPGLNGTVERIAADTSNDQRTGQSFCIVRISISDEEVAGSAASSSPRACRWRPSSRPANARW
jgi:hypothetical protein